LPAVIVFLIINLNFFAQGILPLLSMLKIRSHRNLCMKCRCEIMCRLWIWLAGWWWSQPLQAYSIGRGSWFVLGWLLSRREIGQETKVNMSACWMDAAAADDDFAM